jgi:hypothetical protein
MKGHPLYIILFKARGGGGKQATTCQATGAQQAFVIQDLEPSNNQDHKWPRGRIGTGRIEAVVSKHGLDRDSKCESFKQCTFACCHTSRKSFTGPIPEESNYWCACGEGIIIDNYIYKSNIERITKSYRCHHRDSFWRSRILHYSDSIRPQFGWKIQSQQLYSQ